MWDFPCKQLVDDSGLRFKVLMESQVASFAVVISALQQDARFRQSFNSCLAATPFKAFRWETPAVTTALLSQAFEFVVLDCPSLDRKPDPDAFAEHFDNSKDGVAAFPNLGGDAIMVVPNPLTAHSSYGHLAAFVRSAPTPQQHALWNLVGHTMSQRVNERPVWLSTAGAGVSWLHVRLDDRPKYYAYAPFRKR